MFLREGFHANGTVSLSGAEIGGQLSCTGGRFENPEGNALNAQGARVKGDVFLRNMGHERGARDVLVARDRKIAAEEWMRAYQYLDGTWAKAWASFGADFRGFINFLSHLFIDYGHRPLKAVPWLVGFWLTATAVAQWAWMQGDMVPNSDVILTSANWAAVHDADHPAKAWEATPEGAFWQTFNRYAWAADVVIPILDFSQTQAWTPTTARGWAGYTLWWGEWVLSAAGWIVLAFAAAGVTGVARRD